MIKNYVNYRIEVVGINERYFEGDLLAVDDKMNLIMKDVEETSKDVQNKTVRRYLGLILMKGDFVSKINVLSKLPNIKIG